MRVPHLHDAKRVVIKVGSLLVADSTSGAVKSQWLNSLAEDISALRKRNIEVILVSSGAVILGRFALGLARIDLKLEEKQAAAACGQIKLIEAWQDALGKFGFSGAQMLLTTEDTQNRRRYLNARNTLNTLLGLGVIPIINENDSITTAEIRYGDNDRLSACVAAMASADTLILLSDIDGLYTADPRLDPAATLIPVVEAITPEIEAMAGDASGHLSNGGMRTKVMAANMATSSGCHMVIARGTELNPLQRLIDGTRSTWFLASDTPLNARKQWIASSVHSAGKITVDAGAVRALHNGKSLLAAGVTDVEGRFNRGDTVQIKSADGALIAHGLIAYPSEEATKLKGKRSEEIEVILGYKAGDELVHRDDLVMESWHS